MESPAHLPPLDLAWTLITVADRIKDYLQSLIGWWEGTPGVGAAPGVGGGGGGGGGEGRGGGGGRKFNMSEANTEKDCSPRPYSLMCTNQNITITMLFSQFENQSESVSDESGGPLLHRREGHDSEQMEYQ